MNFLIISFTFASLFSVKAYANLKCPQGQYQVSGHQRSGYTRSDGTIVKPTSVNTYCKQFTKAYEYSKDRFKNGIPPNWPHPKEQSGIWTTAEKERVTEVLEDFPDVLLSQKINGIYRLKRSKDYPNPASSSDGIIVIYDSAFDPSRNLGRIIAHELSHQNHHDISNTDQQDYRRATGWRLRLESDRNVYWIGRKTGYVEEDGKISYEEDYSNNLEHYLYDADKLKKETPTAYEWIKKHFGDSFQLKRQKR